MAGVSRGRIVSAIITTAVLTGLVAGVILFVSQQDHQRAQRSASQALAAATPTSSATVQFTPAPGITVTVNATPPNGSSSSSTTSYTGGANGEVTTTLPSGYPTPAPTSSAGGGGSGGGATTTPTTASSTATTTTLKDDATLVSYSPIGPITAHNPTFSISATYVNSGTTTWSTSYTFKCRQFCGIPWGGGGTFYQSLAPGQSFTFTGGESITSTWAYQVNNTVWQMWSPVSGYFGPQVVIEIINHGWYLDFQEASPSCMGDGSVWTQQGSSGTVSCGGSGLAMADGGSNGVSLDLHSTPASYDPGNYSMKVHIHFNTSSASVFAGVVITEPTATAIFREVVMVSPAGYMCYQTNTAYCLPPYPTQQITASSDYDLVVTVMDNGTTVGAGSSGGGGFGGGISAGGLTGLIEVASPSVTDAAYFMNYTFYQYK